MEKVNLHSIKEFSNSDIYTEDNSLPKNYNNNASLQWNCNNSNSKSGK